MREKVNSRRRNRSYGRDECENKSKEKSMKKRLSRKKRERVK